MADKAPSLTLADLAGINISDVQEVRFSVLPQMTGLFSVKEAKIEVIGEEQTSSIVVVCKVDQVEKVLQGDPPGGWNKPPEELLDKEHREVFFCKDAEGIGRFKAWCVDAGVRFEGEVQVRALLTGISGMQFPGKIKHRKDKNDPDRIYANVVPIVTKAQAAAA